MIVDVVIVIPAYNEATTVAGVVTAARVHAPVLVVDDGSTDDTALRATEAGAVVIRHPARRGNPYESGRATSRHGSVGG